MRCLNLEISVLVLLGILIEFTCTHSQTKKICTQKRLLEKCVELIHFCYVEVLLKRTFQLIEKNFFRS